MGIGEGRGNWERKGKLGKGRGIQERKERGNREGREIREGQGCKDDCYRKFFRPWMKLRFPLSLIRRQKANLLY
jgi:hypothetical protein